jgi:hypothetical protein
MCKLTKLIALLSIALCACTDTDRPSVPRPHAYPRTATVSDVYAQADSVSLVDFSVNTSARLVRKQNGCDIVYDNLAATIYISVVSNLNTPEKFNEAWKNRVERIDRNLGGATKISSPLNNYAFEGVIITSHSVSQTPVHLLAASTDRGIIVSATAFLHNNIPSNAYDSIAPVYKVIAKDITKLGESLQCK